MRPAVQFPGPQPEFVTPAQLPWTRRKLPLVGGLLRDADLSNDSRGRERDGKRPLGHFINRIRRPNLCLLAAAARLANGAFAAIICHLTERAPHFTKTLSRFVWDREPRCIRQRRVGAELVSAALLPVSYG